MTRNRVRWITWATCAWTVGFAAPHTWWALGIPAGFPGGQSSYDFFISSSWRYIFNVLVVVMSLMGFLVARTLARPPMQVIRRWIPYAAAWIACGMLGLRGIAGMIVDGVTDLVWWPTFLLGGILFGAVASNARRDRSVLAAP